MNELYLAIHNKKNATVKKKKTVSFMEDEIQQTNTRYSHSVEFKKLSKSERRKQLIVVLKYIS